MSHISVGCIECSTPHSESMAVIRCERCGGPLGVSYVEGADPPVRHRTGAPLPIHDADALVSLGEGNTPCVHLAALGRRLGLDRLFVKLEFANPTGSFKDRGTAVMLSAAREQRVARLAEDSSGNAGASVAAYAARAGIEAHVFAPSSAPAAKMRQIAVYGAEAHPVPGPRDVAADAAAEYCKERRMVYASHNLSPYFLEGTKTFAYEAVEDLPDAAPDHIVMPVGNGSLLIGVYLGFLELTAAGAATAMPRLHCVQSSAVMPVAAAYLGEEWAPTGAETVAGGISVASPPRIEQALGVLSSTAGVALHVGDEAILEYQKILAESEGIHMEPTSAAAFAGLEELVRSGAIGRGESVLVPVTGSGLKDTPPG